jgi:hypothetical protein
MRDERIIIQAERVVMLLRDSYRSPFALHSIPQHDHQISPFIFCKLLHCPHYSFMDFLLVRLA